MNYVRIERNHLQLNNGCRIFLKPENEVENDLYQGIDIPEGLLQPEKKERVGIKVYGFTRRYPKIWLFDGPKII